MMTKSLAPRFAGSLLVLLLALLAHAETQPSDGGKVRLAELSAPVQKTIQAAVAGGALKQIEAIPATYAAHFDFAGQKTELRVSASGQILRSRSKQEAEALFEEEQRLAAAGKLNTVALESLPERARARVEEAGKGGKIEQIVKTPGSYRVVVAVAGADKEFRVAEDGSLLPGH